MLEVLVYFQLPRDVEGDMDGLCADGDGWGNVTLQGVAHHDHLVWLDAKVATQL